jgi:hypothetical protein
MNIVDPTEFEDGGGTSAFEDEADIEIPDLPPDAPPPPDDSQPRNAYLYVETRNMPDLLASFPQVLMRLWLAVRMVWLRVMGREAMLERSEAKSAQGEKHTQLGVDEKAQGMPTYLVHVFHDTGRLAPLAGGGSCPILHAQPSFGYFFRNRGPLCGWRHRLRGVGRDEADEISPNFYRIAMPETRAAKVTVRIEAIERVGCAWLWGIIVEVIKRLFGRR